MHLADFPELHEDWTDQALEGRWDTILAVRTEAAKVLEKLRADKVIGHSLDARVDLYVESGGYVASGPSMKELLEGYADQLTSIFIVSEVVLHPMSEAPSGCIRVPVVNKFEFRY